MVHLDHDPSELKSYSHTVNLGIRYRDYAVRFHNDRLSEKTGKMSDLNPDEVNVSR